MRALGVMLEHKGPLDPLGKQELMVSLVAMDRGDLQDLLVQWDRKERLEVLAALVYRVCLDLLVTQAPLDQLECREQWALLV